MLWGGLRPIPERFLLDSVALLGLSYAVLSPHTATSRLNALVLLATCYLTAATTGGWTNRWTLTFPMVPIVVLQMLRRLVVVAAPTTTTTKGNEKLQGSSNGRLRGLLAGTITALSCLCILAGAALTILFPAVELSPIEGPYNVGVVDFHLSVDTTSWCANDDDEESKTCSAGAAASSSQQKLPVRLLYPTNDTPDWIPYLGIDTADDFCHQNMKNAAPPPLNGYGWILHTWKLTTVRAKRHASLITELHRLPVIVVSHGLFGTAELYTYQAMSLAAHGNVVLLLNHQDGSAPVVRLADGSTIEYDVDIVELWKQGQKGDYVTQRRARTDWRVQELVAATEALHQLNVQDAPELLGQANLSLRGRLDVKETAFMGHSFGGATALTAAARRPDLVQSVIAHEPAVDWMPDDGRRSIFPRRQLEDLGLSTNLDQFTWGFGAYNETDYCHATMTRVNDNNDDTCTRTESLLHEIDTLVLFSHEWYEQKLAGSHIMENMHKKRRGKSGNDGDSLSIDNDKGVVSEFGVVDQAYHSEFSDTPMLMPLWLARSIGHTGPRNPHETAREIHARTISFLEAARRRP